MRISRRCSSSTTPRPPQVPARESGSAGPHGPEGAETGPSSADAPDRRSGGPAGQRVSVSACQRVSGGLGLTDDPRVHQEQVELVGEAVLLARASRCAGIGPQRRSPARPTRGPTPEARRSLLRPTCSSAQHAVSRCVVVPTFTSDTATGCPRHARHWPHQSQMPRFSVCRMVLPCDSPPHKQPTQGDLAGSDI